MCASIWCSLLSPLRFPVAKTFLSSVPSFRFFLNLIFLFLSCYHVPCPVTPEVNFARDSNLRFSFFYRIRSQSFEILDVEDAHCHILLRLSGIVFIAGQDHKESLLQNLFRIERKSGFIFLKFQLIWHISEDEFSRRKTWLSEEKYVLVTEMFRKWGEILLYRSQSSARIQLYMEAKALRMCPYFALMSKDIEPSYISHRTSIHSQLTVL